MTTRRELLVAIGAGALAAPLTSFAQQPAKVARIGFLGAESAAGYRSQADAFRTGLRDIGYVEGKNILVEYRWAEGKYDRLPDLAAELAGLRIDVLVTHGVPGTLAAKRATTTIPIVMAATGDAVATGLVNSLARPGGNVTGSTFFVPELNAKRLELLKDAMPRMNQAAVLFNPDNPVTGPVMQAMEIAAKTLKVELRKFEARGHGEFESAFSAMAKRRVDAVLIPEYSLYIVNAKRIASLTTKERLPAAGFNEFAEAGGLIGYGVNFPDLFRRAAAFVDKILKGAKPSDLPVERAIRFEMVVNLKTAKTLGIKIPQSILLRADKVIE